MLFSRTDGTGVYYAGGRARASSYWDINWKIAGEMLTSETAGVMQDNNIVKFAGAFFAAVFYQKIFY